MMVSDSIDQLIPALIAAQGEFPPIPRDGFNPHFKSRFSTLKAVQQATRPVLAKHGLALTQWPATVDGKPALTTWLAHSSGQFISETTVLSLAKSDPQSQGSGITYLRRYAWSSILGLVTDEDDDDGNKASQSGPGVRQEFGRLVEVSKRAGLAKEDVEGEFLQRYGRPLTADPSLLTQIGEFADNLLSRAVQKEMAQ